MNNSPSEPLITITSGNLCGRDISDSIATAMDIDNPSGGYYLLTGPRAGWSINPILNVGEISTWKACTAVPGSLINRVLDAFYGSELTEEQEESLLLLDTYAH